MGHAVISGHRDLLTVAKFWQSLPVLYKLSSTQQLTTSNEKVVSQGNVLFLLNVLIGNLCQTFIKNYINLTRWKKGRWGMKLFLGVGYRPTLVQLWESLPVLYKVVARDQLAAWNQKLLHHWNVLFLLKTPSINLSQNIFRNYVILTRWKYLRWTMILFP